MSRRWILVLFACVALACVTVIEAAGQGDKKAEQKDKKEEVKEELILGKSVGQWIKILREDDNPKLRRAALIALEGSNTAGRIGRESVLNAIEKDKDVQVRVEAILLMGRLGPSTPGALRTIAAALQTDKAGEVREAAATTMGSKFTEKASEYISALAESLKDPHAGTRVAVAGALRNMGDDARPTIPALLEAAKNPKEQTAVRIAAIHIVTRHGKTNAQVQPLLLDMLKNAENQISLRDAAIDGLARLGTDSTDAIAAICETLVDRNTELRKASAIALGTLGVKAKSGWPAIKARLVYKTEKGTHFPTESDSGIRNHLIRLAGTLGKTQPEAVVALADAVLKDDATENRIAAIQELGEIGPQAKAAIDALDVAEKDGRAAVREAASKALKQIRP